MAYRPSVFKPLQIRDFASEMFGTLFTRFANFYDDQINTDGLYAASYRVLIVKNPSPADVHMTVTRRTNVLYRCFNISLSRSKERRRKTRSSSSAMVLG